MIRIISRALAKKLNRYHDCSVHYELDNLVYILVGNMCIIQFELVGANVNIIGNIIAGHKSIDMHDPLAVRKITQEAERAYCVSQAFHVRYER